MNAAQWQQAKELIAKALLQPVERRVSFLEESCPDPTLRAEVLALLEQETASMRQSEEWDDPTRRESSSGPSPNFIGPYRLLQRIGEGGMGEVWLAEQNQPIRRHVALKLIKAGMDTAQVVARFEAERQALAVMTHPAIAQVFDAGATPEGRPYFAMEYVRGEAITSYCDRHRLSTSERIVLFLEVCEAVQHAHQRGIIHRDLKPSNILVTLLDDHPVPKIIDFGIAKATTQHLTDRTLYTELGMLIGTPEYMSPEQAEMTGLDIDTRTDVYALGVILYELLSGTLPFESTALRGKGLDEIRRIIRDTDPARPSTRVTSLGPTAATVAHDRRTDQSRLASQLRGDLDWITMKALEKDRTRRYGAVSDFAADLRRHLEDLPVLASPPSTAYRLAKFARRHRFGVAVGATTFALLVAFVLTMAIQTRTIARERDRAERVSAFLVGLFEASDPDKTKGDTVTARELLDKGVERLDVELKNEPETRASLLYSIGRIYLRLGRYDTAERALEQALTVRRVLPGRGRLDLAATLNDLGNVLGYKGNLAGAERLYRESLDIRMRALGANDGDVARSTNNLAGIAFQRGHYDEAERLYIAAVSSLKKVGPPEDVARPLINLGLTLLKEGKRPEAMNVLRESVEIGIRHAGRESRITVTALNNLSETLFDAGEYQQAEQQQREVLAIRRKVFGENHFDVAMARYNLGNTLNELGRFDEAAQMLRESVAVYRSTVPDPNNQTAWALTNLGSVEYRRGQYDEAERLHREAAAMFQKLDADPTNVGKPWYGIGEVLYRRGESAEAEKYFRMDLELLKKYPNTPSGLVAWPEMALGRLFTERGDPDEAEPLLRHAVASLHTDSALPWQRAYAEVLLGACLTSLRRFEEAGSLLQSGYAVLHTKRGDNRDETRYAATALVALFEAWDKPDEAATWRANLANHRDGDR